MNFKKLYLPDLKYIAERNNIRITGNQRKKDSFIQKIEKKPWEKNGGFLDLTPYEIKKLGIKGNASIIDEYRIREVPEDYPERINRSGRKRKAPQVPNTPQKVAKTTSQQNPSSSIIRENIPSQVSQTNNNENFQTSNLTRPSIPPNLTRTLTEEESKNLVEMRKLVLILVSEQVLPIEEGTIFMQPDFNNPMAIFEGLRNNLMEKIQKNVQKSVVTCNELSFLGEEIIMKHSRELLNQVVLRKLVTDYLHTKIDIPVNTIPVIPQNRVMNNNNNVNPQRPFMTPQQQPIQPQPKKKNGPIRPPPPALPQILRNDSQAQKVRKSTPPLLQQKQRKPQKQTNFIPPPKIPEVRKVQRNNSNNRKKNQFPRLNTPDPESPIFNDDDDDSNDNNSNNDNTKNNKPKQKEKENKSQYFPTKTPTLRVTPEIFQTPQQEQQTILPIPPQSQSQVRRNYDNKFLPKLVQQRQQPINKKKKKKKPLVIPSQEINNNNNNQNISNSRFQKKRILFSPRKKPVLHLNTTLNLPPQQITQKQILMNQVGFYSFQGPMNQKKPSGRPGVIRYRKKKKPTARNIEEEEEEEEERDLFFNNKENLSQKIRNNNNNINSDRIPFSTPDLSQSTPSDGIFGSPQINNNNNNNSISNRGLVGGGNQEQEKRINLNSFDGVVQQRMYESCSKSKNKESLELAKNLQDIDEKRSQDFQFAKSLQDKENENEQQTVKNSDFELAFKLQEEELSRSSIYDNNNNNNNNDSDSDSEIEDEENEDDVAVTDFSGIGSVHQSSSNFIDMVETPVMNRDNSLPRLSITQNGKPLFFIDE